jgi:hypothetical protein
VLPTARGPVSKPPHRGARHGRGVLGQAHHGAQPVEGLRHLLHLVVRTPAISPSPAPFSNESNSSSVSSRTSVMAAGSSTGPIPRRLPPVAAEFGDQRDHAGGDAGHQPIGSFPCRRAPAKLLAPPGKSAMSAPRWSGIRSRPARGRSQRFCSAATRELRRLISRAIVPAERVSWSSRIREQTTAFNLKFLGNEGGDRDVHSFLRLLGVHLQCPTVTAGARDQLLIIEGAPPLTSSPVCLLHR